MGEKKDEVVMVKEVQGHKDLEELVAAAHVSGIVTDLAAAFTDDPSVLDVLPQLAVLADEASWQFVGHVLERAKRIRFLHTVLAGVNQHPSDGVVQPDSSRVVATDASPNSGESRTVLGLYHDHRLDIVDYMFAHVFTYGVAIAGANSALDGMESLDLVDKVVVRNDVRTELDGRISQKLSIVEGHHGPGLKNRGNALAIDQARAIQIAHILDEIFAGIAVHIVDQGGIVHALLVHRPDAPLGILEALGPIVGWHLVPEIFPLGLGLPLDPLLDRQAVGALVCHGRILALDRTLVRASAEGELSAGLKAGLAMFVVGHEANDPGWDLLDSTVRCAVTGDDTLATTSLLVLVGRPKVAEFSTHGVDVFAQNLEVRCDDACLVVYDGVAEGGKAETVLARPLGAG